MVFNTTFNNLLSYIVAVSCISGGHRGPGENHRYFGSHRQANVLSKGKSSYILHLISQQLQFIIVIHQFQVPLE